MAATSGCRTTWRKSREDVPVADRGVTELRQLMADFNESLREGRLQDGHEMMEEIRAGVAEADDVTRAHPDFEDLRAVAQKAPDVFAAGVRAKATQDLGPRISRAQTLAGNALTRPLTQAELRELEGISDSLLDTASAMTTYAVSDLESAVDKVKVARASIENILERVRWGRKVDADLGELLRDAKKEADIGSNPRGLLPRRAEALERAVGYYGSCLSRVESARREAPPDVGAIRWKTELGELTLSDTAFACELRKTNLSEVLTALRSQQWLGNIASQLNEVDKELKRASTAEHKISAFERAIQVVGDSVAELERGKDDPARGRAPTQAQTPYGNLTSGELVAACKKMLQRYDTDLATTRYRVSLSKTTQARDLGRSAVKKAKPKSPSEARSLGDAVIALRDCVSRADSLSNGEDIKKAADGTLSSRRRSVQQIEGQCKQQLKRAHARLESLRKANYVRAPSQGVARRAAHARAGKRGRAARKKVARRGKRNKSAPR